MLSLRPVVIFLDSDIIISSFISDKGAAYFLVENKHPEIELAVSNLSLIEIKKVTERLGLTSQPLDCIKTVQLSSQQYMIEEYNQYVLDDHDAHIVGGAVAAEAQFLISYNHKHFKIDKIKKDFGIKILTPAQFLQYLRSLQSTK